MLIPYKIEAEINPYSGWIDPSSKLSRYSVERLFQHIYNKEYLTEQLYTALTDKAYLYKYNKEFLTEKFKHLKDKFPLKVYTAIDRFPVPLRSDNVSNNPVTQLGLINRDFLEKMAHLYVDNYMTIFPEFENANPDTGKIEDSKHSQYTARSYNDGTWKPEELFMNHPIARKNTQWKLTDIKQEDPYRRWGGYKFWNITPSYRPYDRENQEGFGEGGVSDRRDQIPHGYGKEFKKLSHSGHKKTDVFHDELMYYSHYRMRQGPYGTLARYD